MRVVVGGGSGFVGSALGRLLRGRGHVLTLVSRRAGPQRITWDELGASGLPPCDAAVNLAGENVLNPLRRWNEAFQREVLSSRLETTRTLAKAIASAAQPPRAWVLVTGVGYYRPSPTAEYHEDSPGGDFDFFSRLVSEWEAAAEVPEDSTRLVLGSCWAAGAAPSARCCRPSGWVWAGPSGRAASPSPGSTWRTWRASWPTPWRGMRCEGSSMRWPRPSPPTPSLPGPWGPPWGARPSSRSPASPCVPSSGGSVPPCCWTARRCCPGGRWPAATSSSSRIWRPP
ncbi:epimerase family protein SDR39U1 isoform X2 [Ornithorhynchus anatinus]|uniref:epimerase family protein SDR39U1 isoform X2 n=1 Tax=Ornithorhynchus anatinus TaxID=9258 RepID=UPI0010A7671C|nr:epimerase family protein SDR39U1 isoform X2 [Ornithorhynchus anatinus]